MEGRGQSHFECSSWRENGGQSPLGEMGSLPLLTLAATRRRPRRLIKDRKMVGNLVRRLVHGETDTEARRNSGRIFWTGGKLRGNGPGAAPWWRRSAKIEGGRCPNDVLRRAAQDI